MYDFAGTESAELVKWMSQKVAERQAEIARLAAVVERNGDAVETLAKTALETGHLQWVLGIMRLVTFDSASHPSLDDVHGRPLKPAPRCGLGQKDRACG